MQVDAGQAGRADKVDQADRVAIAGRVDGADAGDGGLVDLAAAVVVRRAAVEIARRLD